MRKPTNPAGELLPWLTPLNLSLGLAGFCVLVMGLGTCALYAATGPMPPPRPPPAAADPLANISHRFKEGFYRSVVDDAARRLGVKPAALKGLWRPNGFFAEFTGEQRLQAGGAPLETQHLRLQAVAQKIWAGEEGQGFRTEHLLLQITNRSNRHLAYRVDTRVSGRCVNKGTAPHNALALAPAEQIVRTECILNGAGPLVVQRVEILEVSPLGYYLVSQLDPLRLDLDSRTSDGHHEPPQLGACKLLPWREIKTALGRGEASWADLMDFYSRHPCDEYTFFAGYRRIEKGPVRLPVRPPSSRQ